MTVTEKIGLPKPPKSWTVVIVSLATIASAVMYFFDILPHRGRSEDGAPATATATLQTLTSLKNSVDNLNTTLEIFAADRDSYLRIANGTKTELGKLVRKMDGESADAADRHSEVMAKLDDFEKKGIKRR